MFCIPAEGLGYSFHETEIFGQAKQRYDGSPAKELLLDWSHKNPTVSDLYRHLLANKLNHAADQLKEYGKFIYPLSVGTYLVWQMLDLSYIVIASSSGGLTGEGGKRHEMRHYPEF